jgi:hypothetical protein
MTDPSGWRGQIEADVTGVVTSITGTGPDCTVLIQIDQGPYAGGIVRVSPALHQGPEPAVFELGDRWSGTLMVPL